MRFVNDGETLVAVDDRGEPVRPASEVEHTWRPANTQEVIEARQSARVKVTPVSKAYWASTRRVRCDAGWHVVCTEHGALDDRGATFLGVALDHVARAHLRREHS
jgi:hypothetical protein